MSARWFRFYDEALNDPKVQSLSGDLFKAWVNILCLASANDGKLPPLTDIAFHLRATSEQAESTLLALEERGLIDRQSNQHGNTYAPHGWAKRQFKSDTSNERVKRHRQSKRNVTGSVTVTPPETDTETDNSVSKDTEETSSVLEFDPKALLFGPARKWLMSTAGMSDDGARKMLGKWLKAAGDDTAKVLEVFRRCKEARPADPVSWITAAITPPKRRERTFAEERMDPTSPYYGVL